ncbi:FHA domain-containing protein [bacterium]|nr:FHA domain-containing protein [bacterium]
MAQERITNKSTATPKKKRATRRQSTKVSGRCLALSVHSGLMEGAFYPLSRKHNVIGRKVNAHIPIKDAKVSREHATITNNSGDYLIRDLGSTNGTFVNNERVDDPVRLSVGDKIRIGAYTFKVEPVVQRKEVEVQKWSSETKVLFRDPSLLGLAQSTAASSMPKPRKESSFVDLFAAFGKYNPQKFIGSLNQEKVKWVLLAIGVVVVLAATMTKTPDFF